MSLALGLPPIKQPDVAAAGLQQPQIVARPSCYWELIGRVPLTAHDKRPVQVSVLERDEDLLVDVREQEQSPVGTGHRRGTRARPLQVLGQLAEAGLSASSNPARQSAKAAGPKSWVNP